MKPFIRLSFGLLCVLILLAPQVTYAAGTPAGTVISNFATMNYKDLAGNSFPSFNSNTVDVIVVQLAGVDINPTTAAKTVGDSIYVYYPFVVTNTGNGKDVLGLSDVQTHSWGSVFYNDANRNGVLDGAEGTTPITFTDSLDADSSQWVIERFFVPYGTPSNTVDSLTVTTFSHYTNDTLRTATYVTTISTSVLSVTKSVTPTNPKPGDQVTYTIDYSNAGTSPADSTLVTDVLNTNYTFSSFTTIGHDSAHYVSGTKTVEWFVGRVPAGGSGQLVFKVTVNADVPYHTVIDNKAIINYIDSTNHHHLKDSGSSPPVTVNQLVQGNVGPDTTMYQIQDVGLKVVWPMTVYNGGNGTDSLTVVFTSSLGLSYTYYIDVNKDGLLDGGDVVFPAGTVTPALNQFDSLYLLAVATIPTATADRSKDTAIFYWTWNSDPTVKDTVNGILTVRAPLMTLVKSVAVVASTVPGQPVPGATLEYTIDYADTGTGGTDSVVVTDNIPAHTTYVGSSVNVNGSGKTDSGADADGVTANAVFVRVVLPHVNAGGSGTIKFRVKIN